MAKIVDKDGEVTTNRYIRDASGNVMAVYQDTLTLEHHIYGSSRLGLALEKSRPGQLKLGHRQYELSNHLGNVLAVVTDNVNMTTDTENSQWYDSQTWPTLIATNDYYPFGLAMGGRTSQLADANGYRYGFNGKELDDFGALANGDGTEEVTVEKVAAYSFNGSAVDNSGNGQDGTVNGASLTEGQDGATNSAYAFDGSDDKITVPHADALNVSEELSVSVWFKAGTQSEDGVIAAKHEGGNTNNNRGWLLSSGTVSGTYVNKMQLVISEQGSNTGGDKLKIYASSMNLFDNQWHHVAFTFSNGALKLYVDGVEDTEVVKHRDNAMTSIYANIADLTVGYHKINGTASRFLNGEVDDLTIYGEALTATAINYLYTGEEPQENVNETPEAGTGPALADYNHYDYGFRIYNPRIAKFLSVDPLTKSYPWNSPYAFAENDVIRSIDLDGLEKQIRINLNQNGKTTESYVILVNSRGVNAAAQKLNRALVGKDNLGINDDVANRFNTNNAFWTEGFDDYKKITYYYDNSGQFYDNTGEGELTIDIEDGFQTFSYKSEITKDAAYDEAITQRNFGYGYDFASFFQLSGDAATVTGGIISSSVIGAPVGIPLVIGGKISNLIGAGIEATLDIYKEDYKNAGADVAKLGVGLVIPSFGSKKYIKEGLNAGFNVLVGEAQEGVRSSADIEDYDQDITESLGEN